MTAKLLATPVNDGDLDAAHVAEESCLIVRSPGFYPAHMVEAGYGEWFMPVVEKQLATAGARLAAILGAMFK